MPTITYCQLPSIIYVLAQTAPRIFVMTGRSLWHRSSPWAWKCYFHGLPSDCTSGIEHLRVTGFVGCHSVSWQTSCRSSSCTIAMLSAGLGFIYWRYQIDEIWIDKLTMWHLLSLSWCQWYSLFLWLCCWHQFGMCQSCTIGIWAPSKLNNKHSATINKWEPTSNYRCLRTTPNIRTYWYSMYTYTCLYVYTYIYIYVYIRSDMPSDLHLVGVLCISLCIGISYDGRIFRKHRH